MLTYHLHPKKEYIRRLSELKSFLPNFIQQKNIPQFNLIEAPYIPEDFFSAVNTQIETNLQTEPEKGERCRRCYFFRMKAQCIGQCNRPQQANYYR